MQNINDAPLFQATFNLVRDCHLLREKFPKTEKYTLGEKIEESLLAALIAIVEAGHAKKEWKIPRIEAALIKIELAKILFRLALELKILSEKQYLDAEERLQQIGQMLGGWKRSL